MVRVLIIDDSLTVRMDLKDAFEAAGYAVALCPTASAARQELAQGPFDLILVDELLPDANGVEFIRSLRTSRAAAAAPIMLLSSHAPSPRRSGETGDLAEACIHKPYDRSQVIARADQLVGRHGRAPAPGPRKILAVDDSETYLQALAEHLRDEGYELLLARSGEEALALLISQPPDCVLLDLTLPGLSGEEVCRRIRQSPALRSIPVLMLTAREDREAMISSFEAGADDYIPKSSEMEVLKARLLAQLRRKQSEEDHRRVREQLHQKEVEAAEAKASRDLAQMRAAMLENLERKNAELAQAKETAEAANSAKDHFLAVLSHELRTPLTPVLAMVTLLERRSDLAPDLRQDLAAMRRNIEMEARLIDDLLDLTRISRGKVELLLQNVDAHGCIEQAAEICRPDIHIKQLRVEISLRATQYHVRADPARLQQVFWNLLKNAVKFTPSGGLIRVESDNDGGRLIVRVTDNGVGIDPSALPRIFNAFEQGEKTVTRQFGGLGLGLTISKTLVDMHGGRLTAHSDGPKRGSTFTVELDAIAPPARHPQPPLPAAPSSERRAMKILLVEDHEDTLRIMCRLLRGFGHAVQTAASVEAALDLATQEKFDLLISDIGLPDGSGLEIMRQVKSHYPIHGIAVSGFGMDQDVRSSREAGFEQHLTKPVSLQTLEAAIAAVEK